MAMTIKVNLIVSEPTCPSVLPNLPMSLLTPSMNIQSVVKIDNNRIITTDSKNVIKKIIRYP